MENPLGLPLLFVAGLVAGTINVIAGGGSFLTLPILMFLGLPPGVANGTNRVGILLQNVVAVRSFDRHGALDRRAVAWAALPASAGALIGAWIALQVDDQTFKRLLAFLMVAISLYTFWRPYRPSSEGSGEPAAVRPTLLMGAFFLVGIYGGFVQAGVGFFLLAATTAAGLDLVRGNAVKVLTVLCFTALSLAVFALNGRVEWLPGLALAGGTMIGGFAGARLTLRQGHRWVRGVVTAAIVGFAIKLWWG